MLQIEISITAPGTDLVWEQKPALKDYLPLVRFLAESIQSGLRQDAEIDDLYAAGLEGLWEAYSSFQPGRNIRFVSHAQLVVRAAIQDYARHRWESANETDSGAAIPKDNSNGHCKV